jgi:hypothetical protein
MAVSGGRGPSDPFDRKNNVGVATQGDEDFSLAGANKDPLRMRMQIHHTSYNDLVGVGDSDEEKARKKDAERAGYYRDMLTALNAAIDDFMEDLSTFEETEEERIARELAELDYHRVQYDEAKHIIQSLTGELEPNKTHLLKVGDFPGLKERLGLGSERLIFHDKPTGSYYTLDEDGLPAVIRNAADLKAINTFTKHPDVKIANQFDPKVEALNTAYMRSEFHLREMNEHAEKLEKHQKHIVEEKNEKAGVHAKFNAAASASEKSQTLAAGKETHAQHEDREAEEDKKGEIHKTSDVHDREDKIPFAAYRFDPKLAKLRDDIRAQTENQKISAESLERILAGVSPDIQERVLARLARKGVDIIKTQKPEMAITATDVQLGAGPSIGSDVDSTVHPNQADQLTSKTKAILSQLPAAQQATALASTPKPLQPGQGINGVQN